MSPSGPPARPRGGAPRDLGFTRRDRMVPWLSPRLLARTATHVALSAVFGAYADKREIQAVTPAAPLPDLSDRDELWFDFVADVGDGFGPTFSIASLLASPELSVEHDDGALLTRRGSVLVMGGDEVYPSPSIADYRDRTTGPYRAALASTEDDHPLLLAVPGNHDWYDGLTAFLRVFCSGQWIGGWRTAQTRSYFAVPLPHRWWLWGIDVQLDTYVDGPQLAYFRDAARSLRPGDGVVLCSALPSWVHANEDEPEAYRNIDYFERTIIGPTGASVAVALTGDAHHYARYESVDGGCQRITAGGGGAYTSATHHLPEELLVPPPASTDPSKSDPVAFRFAHTWPSRTASAARRLSVVTLPFRNPGFWALVGVVHLALLWTVQSARRVEGSSFASNLRDLGVGEVARAVLRSPLGFVIGAALVFGLMSFTKPKAWWHRAVGVVHAAAHLAAAVLVIRAAVWWGDGIDGDAAFVAFVVVAVGLVGGLVGSWVMAVYLALADLVRLNTNELFAAQRLRSYKHFLRLHVERDGSLTILPIGLRRTVRRWSLATEPVGPWLTPSTPLEPRLIEPPVWLPPRTS